MTFSVPRKYTTDGTRESKPRGCGKEGDMNQKTTHTKGSYEFIAAMTGIGIGILTAQ
jgi:hypothetical protein